MDNVGSDVVEKLKMCVLEEIFVGMVKDRVGIRLLFDCCWDVEKKCIVNGLNNAKD